MRQAAWFGFADEMGTGGRVRYFLLIDLKGELFMLRLQRSARNEFKSSDFRRMRKRVILFLLSLCLHDVMCNISWYEFTF